MVDIKEKPDENPYSEAFFERLQALKNLDYQDSELVRIPWLKSDTIRIIAPLLFFTNPKRKGRADNTYPYNVWLGSYDEIMSAVYPHAALRKELEIRFRKEKVSKKEVYAGYLIINGRGEKIALIDDVEIYRDTNKPAHRDAWAEFIAQYDLARVEPGREYSRYIKTLENGIKEKIIEAHIQWFAHQYQLKSSQVRQLREMVKPILLSGGRINMEELLRHIFKE